jgi:hypothetical protein
MRGVLDKALPWLRLKVSQVRMTSTKTEEIGWAGGGQMLCFNRQLEKGFH